MYEIRDATVSDAKGLVQVSMRAFANDAANRAVFARDPSTDEFTPSVMSWRLAHSEEDLKNNPAKHNRVAVDEAGNIIAYASWLEPRTAEQLKEDKAREEIFREKTPFPEGVKGDIFVVVGEMRKKAMLDLFGTDEEKDYWYLHYLATLPEFEGRGIASKLVQWGLEKADAQGKRVFIESTPGARGFYEKHGCVKKGEMPLLDGDYIFHLMVREPKALN